MEAALEVYRKVVAAIEDSDEVTRAVLDDAVPRLHAAADRLVDVAEAREKAAEVARELGRNTEASAGTARQENLRELEERIRAADAEISGTSEELLDLRAKVVRISIDANNPARAKDLNASLDGLNARLEALSETMSPRGRELVSTQLVTSASQTKLKCCDASDAGCRGRTLRVGNEPCFFGPSDSEGLSA